MSELSQAQKNKLNNFLRSLNQRITNFVEEVIAEEGGVKGEGELAKKKAEENEMELDELLRELKEEEGEKKTEKEEKMVFEEEDEGDKEVIVEKKQDNFGNINALLDKVLEKN